MGLGAGGTVFGFTMSNIGISFGTVGKGLVSSIVGFGTNGFGETAEIGGQKRAQCIIVGVGISLITANMEIFARTKQRTKLGPNLCQQLKYLLRLNVF